MERVVAHTLFEDRLSALRPEMTAERFARLVGDVTQIEARCNRMTMDGWPTERVDEFIRGGRIRFDDC